MAFVAAFFVLAAIGSVTVECVLCPPQEPVKDICSGQCTGNAIYCQQSPDSKTFKCICPLGYRYNSSLGSCDDINECNDTLPGLDKLHDCDEAFRATCVNTIGSYKCQCTTPYYQGDGHICNRLDGEKCSKMCPGNKYCMTCKLSMWFGIWKEDSCFCQTGFKVSDFGCVDINECDNDCKCDMIHGECINSFPGYRCRCKPGYEGNGVYCIDVNECRIHPSICDEHAECINSEGSYHCQCSYGYSGDGDTCETDCEVFKDQSPDVNECTACASLCPADSTCVNTVGSYYCRCHQGYEWDEMAETCIDIDECIRGVSGCLTRNSSWIASCTNTIGDFECQCNQAFDGDGHYCQMPSKETCGLVCAPRTEVCADVHVIPAIPRQELCLCQMGYKRTYEGVCVDIKECSDVPTPCDQNAHCVELSPSYICLCNEGYDGTGFYCRDKDECASTTTNNCGENTDCVNTNGSYKCVCSYGYTGDGTTCRPVCP